MASAPRRPAAARSAVRSLLLLPTDYGLLCGIFVLWGSSQVFLGVYSALLLASSAVPRARLREVVPRDGAPVLRGRGAVDPDPFRAMTAVGSHAPALAGDGPHPRPAADAPHPPRGFETLLALGLSFVLAIRFAVSPGVPVCYLVAAVFLPVTVSVLRRYRGITWVVLALGGRGRVRSRAHLARGRLRSVQPLPGHRPDVARGRHRGRHARAAVGTIGRRHPSGGAVLRAGRPGLPGPGRVSPDNPWKFSLSVPVTLIVLGLPWVYRRPLVETMALVGLAAVSALNDGRSAAAMMLIGAALVMTQGPRTQARRTNSFVTLARLAMIAVGGFYLVQAAILNGELGEAAQARTEAQIEASGSVLLGGPPRDRRVVLTHHRTADRVRRRRPRLRGGPGQREDRHGRAGLRPQQRLRRDLHVRQRLRGPLGPGRPVDPVRARWDGAGRRPRPLHRDRHGATP